MNRTIFQDCSPSVLAGAVEVVLQPEDATAERRQVLHVHAHAAAILKDGTVNAFTCRPEDHLQSALLAGAPDVGRLAAQGGFFKVTGNIHAPNYKSLCEGRKNRQLVRRWQYEKRRVSPKD